MAVRIDMDMPKSCKECLLKRKIYGETIICSLTFKTINTFVHTRTFCRHPKCPIKEIKEK